jgi:hypothetical protein
MIYSYFGIIFFFNQLNVPSILREEECHRNSQFGCEISNLWQKGGTRTVQIQILSNGSFFGEGYQKRHTMIENTTFL